MDKTDFGPATSTGDDQAGLSADDVASGGGRRQSLRRALYRVRQSRMSMVASLLVLAIVLVGLVGPFLAPFPEHATGTLNISNRLQPPSLEHPFGTDSVGRDNLSRILIGAQISLLIAAIVVPLAAFIGTMLGALAGYVGGVLSEVVMRLTDIFMTIPALILAVTIAAALGASLTNTAIAIAVVRWPLYTRLVHGQVLKLREEGYVEAAQSIGASGQRIILRHIIPNAMSPIIVQMSLDVGFAILTTAALGFLGIGVRPPTPEWGTMVSEGRSSFPIYWWNVTFPGLAIFVTVLAFNLFGDGLRDLLDPRTRR
jgi:peptide/nickel transport system permease protein